MDELGVPNPALKQLDRFVGTWRTVASLDDLEVGRGSTAFWWGEGGGFLVQRAEGESIEGAPNEWVENAPFPTVAAIGLDDASGYFSMLYADARGVCRVYQMSLESQTWRIWGKAVGFEQRFEGTFSDDGDRITGFWEASEDGSTWRRDFDIVYTRTGEG